MSAKIDISPEQLDSVQVILRAHLPKGTLAWAFGSRVTWTAKPFSDLDLAVEGAAPLPLRIMGDLQEAFENSDLPWRVDVIDLKSVSPEFRAIVERQRVPADWTDYIFEDCLEVLIDYRGKSPQKSDTGIPVLSAKVVKTDGLVRPIEQKIAVDYYPKWMTRGFPKVGDVVFTTEGPLGEVIQLDEETAKYALGQRIVCLRGRKGKLDNSFLRYLLTSPNQRAVIEGRATGTTVLGISQKALREMPVCLPPVDEQVGIGAILSALDDKIELNRQMNQTLEALARAVFEDWFVAYGPTRRKMAGETDPAAILGGLLPLEAAAPLAPLFPDQFGDNGLPLGWEGKTLGDVVEPRKGRNITKKTVTHGTVPVVAGGLSPAYYHDTANVTGPVITASASGANAGFVRLYNQDIWASDCSYISREQTDYLFTIYAMLSSRQDEIYSMQQGAAQPHVYPSDLKRLAIADAPAPIWQACEELLSPMFKQLDSNEQENQTLAATRDLLLPKLMSGELRLVSGEAVE